MKLVAIALVVTLAAPFFIVGVAAYIAMAGLEIGYRATHEAIDSLTD